MKLYLMRNDGPVFPFTLKRAVEKNFDPCDWVDGKPVLLANEALAAFRAALDGAKTIDEFFAKFNAPKAAPVALSPAPANELPAVDDSEASLFAGAKRKAPKADQ